MPGFSCDKCNRKDCHLVTIRVYIYDPPRVQSFYKNEEWCVNCLVAEAIMSKFKGKTTIEVLEC